MLRYSLPLALFFILAIFLGIGLKLDPRDIGSTLIDKPAPAFQLPQLEDTTNTLSDKEFLGKVSLFNVWASWCTTCRYEHPLLMALAESQKVAIYGLNYKDTIVEARSVLVNEGNPYLSNAFDEKGNTGIDWGVTGTPETFIIDKKGVVRYKHTGQLTDKVLQETIFPLIETLEKS